MAPVERQYTESVTSSMFSDLHKSAPAFETRKALVIINMQNDTFLKIGNFSMVMDDRFRRKSNELAPEFRRIGDVFWVRTEIPDQGQPPALPTPSHSPALRSVSVASQGGRSASVSSRSEVDRPFKAIQTEYYPSSRAKAALRKASDETRSEQRTRDMSALLDKTNDDTSDSNIMETAKIPRVYEPGSKGAAFTDDTCEFMELDRDTVITKCHFSAFDATPLLMTLRMKLVTHIYLTGSMTNMSINATAADAVRHGFEVTVIEDCLGYRDYEKHVEAMREMADVLGVSTMKSSEVATQCRQMTSPRIDEEDEGQEDDDDDSIGGLSSDGLGEEEEDNALETASSTTADDATTNGDAKAIAQELADFDLAIAPARQPGEPVAEGDSHLMLNALSDSVVTSLYERLRDEIDWRTMHHRSGEVPRRVAVQGEFGPGGSVPIYRHPVDESPPFFEYSPIIRTIRDELQLVLRQPLNHVLIQYYRDGTDHISEHSDKTLDIVRGSNVVNLSLGAERTMTLRTKRSADTEAKPGEPANRQVEKVVMPHNSVFVLGWNTNAKWLHGIRPDKRPAAIKSDDESAFDGGRISLTFRQIGTYTNIDRTKIWGQGARSKSQATAGNVARLDVAERDAMIRAFGRENQQTDFDWDAEYGMGYDALDLVVDEAPLETATLHMGDDKLSNMRVLLAIFERNIPCRVTRRPPGMFADPRSPSAPSGLRRKMTFQSTIDSLIFVDKDEAKTDVSGDLPVLYYLSRKHPSATESQEQQQADTSLTAAQAQHAASSTAFGRVTQANELLFLWQQLAGAPLTASTRTTHRAISNFSSAFSEASSHSSGLSNSSTSTVTRRAPELVSPATTVSAPVSPSDEVSAGTGALAPTVTYCVEITTSPSTIEPFRVELEVWESYLEETPFVAGDTFCIADCAFWPTLDAIIHNWLEWEDARYPYLLDYWRRTSQLDVIQRAKAELANPSGDTGLRVPEENEWGR